MTHSISVERDEWSGLSVVDLEPASDCLLIVVRAPLLLGTLHQPGDEFVGVGLEKNDSAYGVDHGVVESLSLSRVPWETVENVTTFGIGLTQPLINNRYNKIIGDQITRSHDSLDLVPQVRAS